MEQIDRLGWAAGMIIASYGVRIGIRTNLPEVLGRVVERLPYGWKPVRGRVVEHLYSLRVGGAGRRRNVRQLHLLYGNITKLVRSKELEPVLSKLETDLQICVAENARHRVFVHAGAVGWKGKAALFPGSSFSGKSTLVAELVRRGATYFSDEYALLDSRGRVHPFARPLGIRDDPTTLPAGQPVEAFGGSAASRPLPVGLVVVASYHPEAAWRPRRLTPGQGVMALMANTVPVRQRPRRSMAALGRVARQASFLRGRRGEAGEVAEDILRRLEGVGE